MKLSDWRWCWRWILGLVFGWGRIIVDLAVQVRRSCGLHPTQAALGSICVSSQLWWLCRVFNSKNRNQKTINKHWARQSYQNQDYLRCVLYLDDSAEPKLDRLVIVNKNIAIYCDMSPVHIDGRLTGDCRLTMTWKFWCSGKWCQRSTSPHQLFLATLKPSLDLWNYCKEFLF